MRGFTFGVDTGRRGSAANCTARQAGTSPPGAIRRQLCTPGSLPQGKLLGRELQSRPETTLRLEDVIFGRSVPANSQSRRVAPRF